MADRGQGREPAEEGADSGLKVTDRRLFTQDGQLREDLPEQAEREREEQASAGSPIAGPDDAPQGGTESAGFEHHPVEEPPGVDFTMLISAMAQPALLFLGEIPHPSSGKAEVDLEQARLQIDMLELLRVKCRGNLNADEEGLLERMLYQLRMLYVSKSPKSAP